MLDRWKSARHLKKPRTWGHETQVADKRIAKEPIPDGQPANGGLGFKAFHRRLSSSWPKVIVINRDVLKSLRTLRTQNRTEPPETISKATDGRRCKTTNLFIQAFYFGAVTTLIGKAQWTTKVYSEAAHERKVGLCYEGCITPIADVAQCHVMSCLVAFHQALLKNVSENSFRTHLFSGYF